MKVKVRLFAGLRDHAGVKDADIEGNNVNEVLVGLIKAYPALGPHIFKDRGVLQDHVRVLLNGIAVSDLDTELERGDELAVFPPVAGG